MEARKKIIMVAIVVGLSFIGLQQASARGWGGGGGYGGDCSCQGAGQGYGQGYQQLDDATKAKVDAFRADTMSLRKEITMKRAEKRALMSSQTPDATAAAKVAGELFDLKMAMAEKVNAAGVPMMGKQGRMGGGPGGKGGHGRMRPPCGNQQGWN